MFWTTQQEVSLHFWNSFTLSESSVVFKVGGMRKNKTQIFNQKSTSGIVNCAAPVPVQRFNKCFITFHRSEPDAEHIIHVAAIGGGDTVCAR